jgi:hypothetical protein
MPGTKEKNETRLERSPGLRVISAAGYPPAPLTGDAGRGCGDASCAPNFSAEIKTNFSFRPTNRPTFEDETSTRAPRLRHLNFS